MGTKKRVVTTFTNGVQDGPAEETVWTTTTTQDNEATLRTNAQNALANNRTYVGLASPTNAQVAAQVKALTQQNNAVIRLLLGSLDATD